MIQIRKLTTMEEMEAVHDLETKIWETEIVPPHQTITVVRNGGLMLGAYDKNQLIGFSYSFPGCQGKHVYLCSHMLGIDPAYRSQGIGEQLKWKQAKIAKDIGYSFITWTFDPLQTRNAYLNLTKLRAISTTYIVNCYGILNDGLNKGLPTDRLEVAWHISSPYVEEEDTYPKDSLTYINEIEWQESIPYPKTIETPKEQDTTYGLVVPHDFDGLKVASSKAALAWRLHTRDLFQLLFVRGFVLVALERNETHHQYIFVPGKNVNI